MNSIEQKAKAYDEALEKSKRLYEQGTITESLAYIFPELKESEDEKIRKSIIAIINNYVDNSNTFKPEMIAWLEKQKTSEEALQYLRENHSSSEVSDFQAAMNIAVAKAYDKGMADAREQMMKNIWKPADGEDLPGIDKEVIVLCKNGRVAFGHRPVKKFMARPIGYGRTEEVEVETYGKGGWNIPDIKWWLDVKFPK